MLLTVCANTSPSTEFVLVSAFQPSRQIVTLELVSRSGAAFLNTSKHGEPEIEGGRVEKERIREGLEREKEREELEWKRERKRLEQ